VRLGGSAATSASAVHLAQFKSVASMRSHRLRPRADAPQGTRLSGTDGQGGGGGGGGAVEGGIDLTLVYARDDEGAPQPGPRRAVLRHISAFASAHYVAFTWSEMAGSWLLRDDTMCSIVGPTFDHVRARCVANCYQPTLLIYETEGEQ
jgi:hypothetical protein